MTINVPDADFGAAHEAGTQPQKKWRRFLCRTATLVTVGFGEAKVEIDPDRAEQRYQRQLAGAMHRVGEEITEIDTCHLRRHGFHTTLGHADAGTLVPRPVLNPKRSHHIVERDAGVQAKMKIEAERNQRALYVIADDSVGCILVLPVVL